MKTLALTIHLPDWLFCGPYWAGFATATALFVAFIVMAAVKTGPRF